ncbi:MAG: hypothetical protein RR450_01995, partial [Oscillospiraceae bacterium]
EDERDEGDEEITLPMQGRRFSKKAGETERLETEQPEGKTPEASAVDGGQTPPLEEQMRRAARQKAGGKAETVPLSDGLNNRAEKNTGDFETLGRPWGEQGGVGLLSQLRRSRQQTKTAFLRPENPTGDLTQSARLSAAEPVNWDALAEREARRYDGGFSLF